MELTIRDWMVIVGVLLIVAVLLDAWRRVRSDRYDQVDMDLVDPELLPPDTADDLAWLKELPNGGGRVVDRDDIQRALAQQSSDNTRNPDRPGSHGTRSQPAPTEDSDLVAGFSATDSESQNDDLEWLDEGNQQPAAPPASDNLIPQEDLEVFMLNVVSRSPQGFRGEDIMEILLACDLRYGEMSFFHRHEQEAGRGAIQFSVANMVQPGVFDLDNMSDMTTKGLVFFLTLPGPDDMMQAFDYMLETAQAVARNLDGDVLDETRSVLSRQTLEHSRHKIRELERRLLAKSP